MEWLANKIFAPENSTNGPTGTEGLSKETEKHAHHHTGTTYPHQRLIRRQKEKIKIKTMVEVSRQQCIEKGEKSRNRAK